MWTGRCLIGRSVSEGLLRICGLEDVSLDMTPVFIPVKLLTESPLLSSMTVRTIQSSNILSSDGHYSKKTIILGLRDVSVVYF